jgi:plastocyanin
MEEFRFVPQALRASPGRLEIVGRNAGRLAHNVTVYRRGEIAGAPSVKRGGSTRVTFRARRGTYRFECSISNHDDLGMYGTLVVR